MYTCNNNRERKRGLFTIIGNWHEKRRSLYKSKVKLETRTSRQRIKRLIVKRRKRENLTRFEKLKPVTQELV